MKNFDENELIDRAMAGRLTRDEQRLWETLLAERPDLEAELQVGRAMRSMEKPPAVSSNFTALVLQQVNRVEPARTRRSWMDWLRLPRLARAAAAAVVLIGLGVGIVHHRNERQVAKSVESFAGGLRAVTAAQPELKPDAVVTLAQDFDTIRSLPAGENNVDYGLLAAFNE